MGLEVISHFADSRVRRRKKKTNLQQIYQLTIRSKKQKVVILHFYLCFRLKVFAESIITARWNFQFHSSQRLIIKKRVREKEKKRKLCVVCAGESRSGKRIPTAEHKLQLMPHIISRYWENVDGEFNSRKYLSIFKNAFNTEPRGSWLILRFRGIREVQIENVITRNIYTSSDIYELIIKPSNYVVALGFIVFVACIFVWFL